MAGGVRRSTARFPRRVDHARCPRTRPAQPCSVLCDDRTGIGRALERLFDGVVRAGPDGCGDHVLKAFVTSLTEALDEVAGTAVAGHCTLPRDHTDALSSSADEHGHLPGFMTTSADRVAREGIAAVGRNDDLRARSSEQGDRRACRRWHRVRSSGSSQARS